MKQALGDTQSRMESGSKTEMNLLNIDIARENLSDIIVEWYPMDYPRLQPLETAKEDDIIAMAARYDVDFEGNGIEAKLHGFCECMKNDVKLVSYWDVPSSFADHAAHLVVENIFFSDSPHKLALDGMVADPVGYKLDVVFFRDAALVVNSDWLACESYSDLIDVEIDPVYIGLDKGSTNDPRLYLALARKMIGSPSK